MVDLMLANVRQQAPLIHCITNVVTVNDCANLLLACGASPIMADDVQEVEEITSICQGLVLNIGTLNQRTIPAMAAAGKKAHQLHHPIVLDPVGAGASALRTQTALQLLEETSPTVIRGNISEIKALAEGSGTTRGVDADPSDQITQDHLEQAVAFAKEMAKQWNAIVAISGPIDLVSDGQRAFCIRNGCPEMARVTGTGCQLSVLITAFLAANPETPLEAAAAAVCAMGLCGEIARERCGAQDGVASYRNYMLDAMSRLTPSALKQGARYALR